MFKLLKWFVILLIDLDINFLILYLVFGGNSVFGVCKILIRIDNLVCIRGRNCFFSNIIIFCRIES